MTSPCWGVWGGVGGMELLHLKAWCKICKQYDQLLMGNFIFLKEE